MTPRSICSARSRIRPVRGEGEDEGREEPRMIGCTTSHYPPNTKLIGSCDGFRNLSRRGTTTGSLCPWGGGKGGFDGREWISYAANGKCQLCARQSPSAYGVHRRLARQAVTLKGEDRAVAPVIEAVPRLVFCSLPHHLASQSHIANATAIRASRM